MRMYNQGLQKVNRNYVFLETFEVFWSTNGYLDLVLITLVQGFKYSCIATICC